MSAKYDFDLYQGATFNRTLDIKDSNSAAVDITNYTFAGQIRTSLHSGSVEGTFVIAISGTPSNGRITWTMSATNTALVPAQQCVYDIEMTQANGDVVRLLEGFVNVKANVTR